MNKTNDQQTLLSNLRNKLEEKRGEAARATKSLKDLEVELKTIEEEFAAAKHRDLVKYLRKCSKHLYKRPGVDWFKIMPLSFKGGRGMIIITQKTGKAPEIVIRDFSERLFEDRNTLWLQDFLFVNNGRNLSSSIHETKAQTQLFKTINTVLRHNYLGKPNYTSEVLKNTINSLLFCYNNPHLEIG